MHEELILFFLADKQYVSLNTKYYRGRKWGKIIKKLRKNEVSQAKYQYNKLMQMKWKDIEFNTGKLLPD